MKRPPKNVLIDNVAIRRRIAGDHDVELTTQEKRRAIRNLHRDGLMDLDIAERLGFTAYAVRQTRYRLGLAANPNPTNHAQWGLKPHTRTREQAIA